MERHEATAASRSGGLVASTPAIRLRDITKRFPGVVANDQIDLTVMPGTIHAIVGENGAGKSTLMKILYGMQPPDEGTIEVGGELVSFKSPKDAIDVGIGMVHQHFMLADYFTVLENIVLGSEPSHAGVIDRDEARQRIEELAGRYGLDIDPDAMVEDLGVGERQRVEILKVLFRGARILILDEPTAVLVPHEVDELFESLRGLVSEGDTVVFISHKLDEVLSVADAITVIRAGKTVAEVPDPSTVSARELAEMMVGFELPTPEAREPTVLDIVEFEAQELTVEDESGRVVLDGVSFTVHQGEVVGIAGVEGNGQTELIGAILGITHLVHGRMLLGGEDYTSVGVRDRRRDGIGYIPEDRHREGLLLAASLWENAMLGHQTSKPYANGWFVDRKGARRRTEEIVEEFDVRTPSIDVSARALSGGNQQKLIVGREIMADPKFLVAAHPTRGIDVGAQAMVWNELRKARIAHMATLLISADLDELIGLSDRLLVLYKGKIVAELDPATVTAAELGSYMTGAASVKETPS